VFIEKVELLRYLNLIELFLETETLFFIHVLWENMLFDKFFFDSEVFKVPSIFRHGEEGGFRNLICQDDISFFTCYYIQCRKEKSVPKLHKFSKY